MRLCLGAAALALLPLGGVRAEAPAPDTCQLSLTARFIGAMAVDQVRRTVQQIARDHPVRWIALGQAITLDANPQRLNVILDENGRIAAIRCG